MTLDRLNTPVVTAEEMRSVDEEAIQSYQLPAAVLMERAGLEVARAAAAWAPMDSSPRIDVVCGTGNNGGDGFVAARTLANWGARVRVWLVGQRERLTGESARFAAVAEKMGLSIATVGEQSQSMFSLALKGTDLIIDALVGTGFSGSWRQWHRVAVDAMNQAGRPILSVDIPSGVDADSGRIEDVAVQAAQTVSFVWPKIGHLFPPGRQCTGRLIVADIGIPLSLLLQKSPPRLWMKKAWAHRVLRPRGAAAHKGTFGRVIVIAGSTGMAGAAVLAARGALHAGVGSVSCLVPASVLPIVQQLVPEAIATPLPERDGQLDEGAWDIIRSVGRDADADAFVVGPGMGRADGVRRLVRRLAADIEAPMVIDADGINALAGWAKEDRPRDWGGPRVLTPHPKEAARLLSTSTQSVVDRPIQSIGAIVDQWGSTCVLKGSPTLVQAPSGPCRINDSGDVSLAAAGTGDVLTGVIGALLAQGYDLQTAAALGVYVHGRAGKIAAQAIGRHGTTAQAIAPLVGQALLELEEGTGHDGIVSTYVGRS